LDGAFPDYLAIRILGAGSTWRATCRVSGSSFETVPQSTPGTGVQIMRKGETMQTLGGRLVLGVLAVGWILLGPFLAWDHGQLVLAPNTAHAEITYIYDRLGRLIGVVDPAGDTAVYQYDAVGNLTGISRQSSALVSVIDFTPASGPVGTTVTIFGTGFSPTPSQNTVNVNGALSVDLTNGFLPATNDAFAVLTVGIRSGTFANFYYPSNEVTMQLSNAPNAVIVRVTGVAPPRPMLLTPELFGSEIRLTWTAMSNITYRVEFKPDLNVTNWTGLPGDVTAVTNTATKLDSLTPSNRFYRVLIVP